MDKRALAALALGSVAAGFAYLYTREKSKAVCQDYDVFLTFRGLDTRSGFTDHLYSGLVAAGFAVFKDDRGLVGKQIGAGLTQAIKNSKIAILIISQRYAESKWCLTELAMIMRRRAEQGLSVFPIFYEVDVRDVHGQDPTTVFGRAFSELAERHTLEQVNEWREALRSVTRIRGYTSLEVAKGEPAKLVEKVVNKVSTELRRSWTERILMFGKKRRQSNCQVFSISSPATTKNFTSHLHGGLVSEKISVFSDDDQYLIGKDFVHEIDNAMDHCKIFIPIISEDFASSPDCLNNLAQMVQCIIRNGSRILPIFYDVDPSQSQEVWDQFEVDMLQHNVLQDTRLRWQESLRQVRLIAGLVSANISNGDKRQLVERAIQEVQAWLRNLNA